MHTILSLSPTKVYPVVTEESAEHYQVPLNPVTRKRDGQLMFFEAIVAHYKEPSQTITIKPIERVVASIGSLDTFIRVREIIQDVRQDNPNAKIAIDITGGKKSADASAFLAAAVDKDIHIYYVDFEDYTGAKACCGTEFLNKLKNPYDIYNIQLLNQGKELFKHYNYQSAAQIFAVIQKKLSFGEVNEASIYKLDDELAEVTKMKLLSDAYTHWDMFEYAEASDEKYKNVLDLRVVKELRHPDISKKIYEVDAQFDYVKKISLDRYENASRRFMQGRYEDAVTRYMQSLEISCKSYVIHAVVNDCLTVNISTQGSDDLSDKIIKRLSNDTWREWGIDYAPISGILNWLLCIQRMNWRNSKGSYSLDKRIKTDFKQSFCNLFSLDKELSKRKFEEQVNTYTNLIEDRNRFIHVSTLSINRAQVQVFRDFVYKMLICLYGVVDLNSYIFSTDFDEK